MCKSFFFFFKENNDLNQSETMQMNMSVSSNPAEVASTEGGDQVKSW